MADGTCAHKRISTSKVDSDTHTHLPMGSAQSYISSEAALTTLVLAGAIGLGYTQIGHGSASTAAPGSATTPQTHKPKQPTKNQKKKKQTNSSAGLSSSGDISENGRTNINDKSQQLLVIASTPTEPGRAVNAPGLPGQFEPTPSPDSQVSDVVASSSMSKAKKPKKKKAKATDPIVHAASSSADYSSEVLTKSKTKNMKRQQQPEPSSSQITRPLQQSTASIETDESWTRVGPVRRDTRLSKNSSASFDATTSDADTGLTPQTGNSSPVAGRTTEGEESSSFLLDLESRESGENRRKTLAEKLLPKPRKTGVEELSFFLTASSAGE